VVYGQLFDDGQGLRLCSGLTRSLPPICVGEPLMVDGLDLASIALENHEGTMWSTDAVVLEGVIDGDTLRDSRVR
jgi:xanthine/uracil permease